MRTGLIALSLVLLLLAAGCTSPASPGATPTAVSAEPRYAAGDLLRGDLAAAGFDDPNGTRAGAAIVVLSYEPVPGQYIYTLVRPVAGGWEYVYPAGEWTTRLARDRTAFEAYPLELAGYVEVARVLPAPTTAKSGAP